VPLVEPRSVSTRSGSSRRMLQWARDSRRGADADSSRRWCLSRPTHSAPPGARAAHATTSMTSGRSSAADSRRRLIRAALPLGGPAAGRSAHDAARRGAAQGAGGAAARARGMRGHSHDPYRGAWGPPGEGCRFKQGGGGGRCGWEGAGGAGAGVMGAARASGCVQATRRARSRARPTAPGAQIFAAPRPRSGPPREAAGRWCGIRSPSRACVPAAGSGEGAARASAACGSCVGRPAASGKRRRQRRGRGCAPPPGPPRPRQAARAAPASRPR
jgi:hypothetical protein